MSVFPYTHGDTVEAARAEIRGEMIEDLRTRDALRDSLNRERTKKSGLGGKYTNGLPAHIEKELRLYPQGGDERVLLRDKFQETIPFFLRENKPTIYRKPNV